MNIESLYRKIKSTMPKNLDEIEKTAYIMKVIAEEKNFSANYYWSDKKTRDKIYELAKKKNIAKKVNRELICVTASKIFKEIGSKFGLDIYYVGDNGKISKSQLEAYKKGEHISPVLKLKQKSKYTDKIGGFVKADVEWNFENIKTKSRWVKFAKKDDNEPDDFIELEDENIDNIMVNIGYIKSKEEYTDLYYETLREKIKGKDLKEQIRILFNDEKLLNIMKRLDGSVEIYRFYRNVFKQTIDKENGEKMYNNKIYLFGAYIKGKKKRKHTVAAYLADDEMIWVYSKKHKKMIEVEPREIKYFIEKDKLNLVPGKQARVLENLLQFIKKAKTLSKNQSNKNINEMVI